MLFQEDTNNVRKYSVNPSQGTRRDQGCSHHWYGAFACQADALILSLCGPWGSRRETDCVHWVKRCLSAGLTRCSPRRVLPSL